MILGASSEISKDIFAEFNPSDYYVICADGGYDNALRFNIQPDLVIGDFDSAKRRPPLTVRTIELPVEKDVTDTMGAVLAGFRLGMEYFVLIGCLGGERFDHSIANINVLLYIADHGGNGVLCAKDTKLFILRGGRIILTDLVGATVSVFPFDGSACNLTYTGLQYPLEQKNLVSGSTLMGVSNRIISDTASVRVNIGCALVILYTGDMKNKS